MILFVSGEGATDLGKREWDERREQEELLWGPMGFLLEHCVRKIKGRSWENDHFEFVDKRELILKVKKGAMAIPSPQRPAGTLYFQEHARRLGEYARVWMREQGREKEDSIAILFRDADGNSENKRVIWQKKRDSIVQGFHLSGFQRGVPMIPKPSSEAWLLALFADSLKQAREREKTTDRKKLKREWNTLCTQYVPKVPTESDALRIWLDQNKKTLRCEHLQNLESFRDFFERLQAAFS